ncbi:hypothetical protein AMECASPLE_026960 [Ameca splendens]|uniref:Uncharacterized protein n=1 Tax=Ameca splendens TaxID=208324 RepID=A0ABV0ZDX9_9TELE
MLWKAFPQHDADTTMFRGLDDVCAYSPLDVDVLVILHTVFCILGKNYYVWSYMTRAPTSTCLLGSFCMEFACCPCHLFTLLGVRVCVCVWVCVCVCVCVCVYCPHHMCST